MSSVIVLGVNTFLYGTSIFGDHDLDIFASCDVSSLGVCIFPFWSVLNSLRRYETSKILGSRPWSFEVTWRWLRTPRHVGLTCRQGVQNDHIFEIFVAILFIHYTTFMGLRWQLGAVYKWNFHKETFLTENLSTYGPIFDFEGFFRCENINFKFCFSKSFDASWGRVVRVVARENLPGGLTCRSVNKPTSRQWTDLHEILHRGSSRERRPNHLF